MIRLAMLKLAVVMQHQQLCRTTPDGTCAVTVRAPESHTQGNKAWSGRLVMQAAGRLQKVPSTIH